MSRSRKPKARHVPPTVAIFERVRKRFALGSIARWALAIAERLAVDGEEIARIDRVRAYVDDLIVGTADEPPMDDIAIVAGILGAAITLPGADPLDEPAFVDFSNYVRPAPRRPSSRHAAFTY
jgi:hypothetical protein